MLAPPSTPKAIARNDRIIERFHISQPLTIDDQRIFRPKVWHDPEQDGRIHAETAALNGIHPQYHFRGPFSTKGSFCRVTHHV
jgi:hypothetical protein